MVRDAGGMTEGFDDGVPEAGGIYHYLVRAVCDCAGAAGTLGTTSSGQERAGRTYP